MPKLSDTAARTTHPEHPRRPPARSARHPADLDSCPAGRRKMPSYLLYSTLSRAAPPRLQPHQGGIGPTGLLSTTPARKAPMLDSTNSKGLAPIWASPLPSFRFRIYTLHDVPNRHRLAAPHPVLRSSKLSSIFRQPHSIDLQHHRRLPFPTHRRLPGLPGVRL